MALNQTIRGRFGTTITEAAIVAERNAAFRSRVTRFAWTEVDDDEPAESMVPIWNEPGDPNKLNKELLWELVGKPIGGDEELRDHLLRELGNREKIWRLLQEAVDAARRGETTPFMREPLVWAIKADCRDVTGKPIDLFGLMHIMHMYGKRDVPQAPRPMHPIEKSDYFYTSEEEVAVEIRRRVRELAAGINWEGNVTGGREKKKTGVWNRYGLYCGCD